MRQSIAALALIRCEDEHGQTLWLAQWNQNWNAYAFVGGHKRPDESFRTCVIRETEEELALRYRTDFGIADRPEARLEYTAWSESAQQETDYTIELFDVELIDSARRKIEAERSNRWLTENEIQAGRTTDGTTVSPTIQFILMKAGLSRSSQAS